MKTNFSFIKFIKCILFVFLMGGILFTNCLIFALTNFTHLDAAEFISSNISLCEKENSTQKVIFEMRPKNKIEPFFKNNNQAVLAISKYQKNSTFLQWELASDVFYSNKGDTINDFVIYGLTGDGKQKEIPFDLNLICGNFNPSSLDSTNLKNPNLNYIFISKTLSNVLFPNQAFDQVVGSKIYNEKLKQDLIISGICDDRTIFNGFQTKKSFIIGNHLNFSGLFEHETLMFKLADEFEANYSLFKKIFYSNSWISPFLDEAYIKLIFHNNEWLESEAKKVYFNEIKVNNNLPLLLELIYLSTGFAIYFCGFNNFRKKTLKNVSFLSLSCFTIFFLFFISEKLVNGRLLHGIHIVGAPIYSIFYAFIGILALAFGFLFAHFVNCKFFKNDLTDKDLISIEI